MESLYLLIPLSVVLAFVIGAFFWRAVDTGQFDDLDGPALSVVADDDTPAGRRSPGSLQVDGDQNAAPPLRRHSG